MKIRLAFLASVVVLFYAHFLLAAEPIEFKIKFNLFSQKLGPEFSMPVQITEKVYLFVQFELPDTNENTLKKVFTKTYEVQDYKTIFEIYFFNQNNLKYFSQQVYLFKNNSLITRCTSYFDVNQKYLVPGSCAGVQDGLLYGVALYKSNN